MFSIVESREDWSFYLMLSDSWLDLLFSLEIIVILYMMTRTTVTIRLFMARVISKVLMFYCARLSVKALTITEIIVAISV